VTRRRCELDVSLGGIPIDQYQSIESEEIRNAIANEGKVVREDVRVGMICLDRGDLDRIVHPI